MGRILTCFGAVEIPFQNNQSWMKTRFYVVDVPGLLVLGLSSCISLGLVSLDCAVRSHHGIGKIPSKPITGSDDLKLCIQTSSIEFGNCLASATCTFVMMRHPTLILLESAPNYEEQYQKWAWSNGETRCYYEGRRAHRLVQFARILNQEDGSLRICLDPAQLNKSLKRCPHEIPTVEELNHKIC